MGDSYEFDDGSATTFATSCGPWVRSPNSPVGENHLLRSMSVVQHVSYGDHTVSYRTFDGAASEVLRLNFIPARVTGVGEVLPTRNDLNQTPSNEASPLRWFPPLTLGSPRYGRRLGWLRDPPVNAAHVSRMPKSLLFDQQSVAHPERSLFEQFAACRKGFSGISEHRIEKTAESFRCIKPNRLIRTESLQEKPQQLRTCGRQI